MVSVITCPGSVGFLDSIGSSVTEVPGITGDLGSGFKTACACALN